MKVNSVVGTQGSSGPISFSRFVRRNGVKEERTCGLFNSNESSKAIRSNEHLLTITYGGVERYCIINTLPQINGLCGYANDILDARSFGSQDMFENVCVLIRYFREYLVANSATYRGRRTGWHSDQDEEFRFCGVFG